ncbi:hypothetical protein B0H11DRAFT_2373511 [Mycena galericulata]|nr:hypothetical protein B0H11DRAFT_2373511 [Mycena galericulata]
MPCSSWGREREFGDKRESIGRQSSLARPVRDRARAKEMQRRASGSRDCRRSSGHMKTSRQAQDTIPGHVEVELVGVATPAAEQLNLEVGVASNGSCRSSATPETVTRVTRLIKTNGCNAGFEGADEFCTAKGRRIGFCEEGGSGREGMNGKEVLHCADRTGGRGIWRGSDDDGDTATERIGLGGGDSKLHVLDTTIFKEPNRVPRKVDSTVKLGTITDGELAASEETCPSQILGRIKDGVVNVRKVASDESETEEDVKRDGEFGLAIPASKGRPASTWRERTPER